MWVKRLLLSAVLAVGLGGVSLGGERLTTNPHGPTTKRITDPHGPTKPNATSAVRRVHSLAVKSQMIAWKVDVQIQGAKGRECVVEIEFCDAAGNPHLHVRTGKPLRISQSVTPDADTFQATNLTFRLAASEFRLLYGPQAPAITFRVIVREEESGRVLNQPTVTTLNGLTDLLPPATPERTDNPNPTRPRSAWMRLIFG